MSFYLCLLHSSPTLLPPPLIPQSQTHTFAFLRELDRSLSLLRQTFIRLHCPALLRAVLFTPHPLSFSPLCGSPPFSSSFQFPLLKWDVVYRGESLSPAAVWVLGGGNGPVMKQRVLLCKHASTRSVGISECECECICVCICARTYRRVAD